MEILGGRLENEEEKRPDVYLLLQHHPVEGSRLALVNAKSAEIVAKSGRQARFGSRLAVASGGAL